ncbi:MAG: RdgB/HAM1 family non-canonical purine NTP pyrophosphatase [Capsulimonadaceae bacterium]|nr:RdgB/HAM1 family non-canonical purine NTP pyrophosphatase [Capsulimonadaceae bacterium]
MQLVIATTNAHKVGEIAAILTPLLPAGVAIRGLEPGRWPEPDENGATFGENALIKARHYSALTGSAALADDSGICVDALGGAPGIYSSRYAPTDSERIAKLLADLRAASALEPSQRRARFVCAAVIVWPDGRTLSAEGVCQGLIAPSPRGVSGFGYDPVFQLADRPLTIAELTPAEKNEISHRSRALRDLAIKLRIAIQSSPSGERPANVEQRKNSAVIG